MERLERPVGRIVFEDDDGDRDRRVDGRRREDLRGDLREGLAKLLQAHPHVANLFFTRVADEREALRLRFQPYVPRRRRTGPGGEGWPDRDEKREGDTECDDATSHSNSRCLVSGVWC